MMNEFTLPLRVSWRRGLQVRGLADLKARLGPGRRCYALFHPCLPDEPLVFVHVALLPNVSGVLGEMAGRNRGVPVVTVSVVAVTGDLLFLVKRGDRSACSN